MTFHIFLHCGLKYRRLENWANICCIYSEGQNNNEIPENMLNWTLSKGILKTYNTMKETCTCQRELKRNQKIEIKD
jgi:hypothetical protein